MYRQPEIMFGVLAPRKPPTEAERRQVMQFIAKQAEQKRREHQAYIKRLDETIAHLKQQLNGGVK